MAIVGGDAGFYWVDDDGEEHDISDFDAADLELDIDFPELEGDDSPRIFVLPDLTVVLQLSEEDVEELLQALYYPYQPGTNFSVN